MPGTLDDGLQFAEPVAPARYTLIATGQYGRPTRNGEPMRMVETDNLEFAKAQMEKYVGWHYDGLEIIDRQPETTQEQSVEASKASTLTAFDVQVAEVNELAKQLPSGRAWRLHQDHTPLHGLVVQWRDDDGIEHYHDLESQYCISEAREIIQKALRRPGRPVERQGHYQRVTLEIREDLLAKMDASGKSRREYIEALLDK